jgi:hypothetical protein
LREVQSEKPNPQPLPYKGRGVRIKASLKSRREVYQRGQSVPHPIEKGYRTVDEDSRCSDVKQQVREQKC